MSINKINNPFIVSKSIPEELFCDRKEETDFLIKQIQNGRNTVIVSPRRMGKTGLIHHLFQQQALGNEYNTFFIDIYSASTLQEMSYLMGKAIFEKLKTKRAQLWEVFGQSIKSLRAGLKIDGLTGEPKLELSLGALEQPTTTLEEIFSFLESSATPCVVAIDEFQQIAEFPEKRVEALLRGLIQNCSNTSFIFSGSKQHTVNQMFHSKARPFYQSAQTLDLKPIALETYCDFATRLFKQYGKMVDNETVAQVYSNYSGTTWYMQMMMNELFSITAANNSGTTEMMEQAQQNIIQVQEGTYQMQLNMLSPKQKSLLQAIAREGKVKSVTSGSFIKKHSLDSTSSVQSALKGLLEKEVVTHDDGFYHVSDYFFGLWIKENF